METTPRARRTSHRRDAISHDAGGDVRPGDIAWPGGDPGFGCDLAVGRMAPAPAGDPGPADGRIAGGADFSLGIDHAMVAASLAGSPARSRATARRAVDPAGVAGGCRRAV